MHFYQSNSSSFPICRSWNGAQSSCGRHFSAPYRNYLQTYLRHFWISQIQLDPHRLSSLNSVGFWSFIAIERPWNFPNSRILMRAFSIEVVSLLLLIVKSDARRSSRTMMQHRIKYLIWFHQRISAFRLQKKIQKSRDFFSSFNTCTKRSKM